MNRNLEEAVSPVSQHACPRIPHLLEERRHFVSMSSVSQGDTALIQTLSLGSSPSLLVIPPRRHIEEAEAGEA